MKLVETNKGVSVFNGNSCVGKLRGKSVSDGLYIIFKIEVFDNLLKDETGKELVTWVRTSYPKKRILCLSWDKKEDIEYEAILKSLGFKIDFEKAYYSRELENMEYIEEPRLLYRPVQDVGRDIFSQILDEVRIGDHAETKSIPIEENFPLLLESMNESWAGIWKVAYFENEIVGIVLPDIFPEKPHMGSLAYFGVVPKFRNKNFGTILHRKGLSLIKELKANEYLDSTHIKNLSMIKIFEANGCKLKGIRRHWTNE